VNRAVSCVQQVFLVDEVRQLLFGCEKKISMAVSLRVQNLPIEDFGCDLCRLTVARTFSRCGRVTNVHVASTHELLVEMETAEAGQCARRGRYDLPTRSWFRLPRSGETSCLPRPRP